MAARGRGYRGGSRGAYGTRPRFDSGPPGTSRGQGQPVDEILRREDWPLPEQIIALLTQSARTIFGDGPLPAGDVLLPQTAPLGPEFWHYDKGSDESFVVRRSILSVQRGQNSRRNMKLLLELLLSGSVHAHKSSYGMILAERALTFRYDRKAPDSILKEGRTFYWRGPCKRPILILGKEDSNAKPVWTDSAKAVLPTLITTAHKNLCNCSEGSFGNNLPFAFYSSICVPREICPEWLEADCPSVSQILSKMGSVMNPSIPFAGRVSAACTVTPFVTLRQPLARLTSDEIIHYEPPMSGMDLMDSHPAILRCLPTVLDKPDFRGFVKLYKLDNGASEDGHHARFLPLEMQRKSLDALALSGNGSMDYVLSNTVHVTPCHGETECPFCGDQIEMKGIRTLVNHLAVNHRALRGSCFACPACLTVNIVSWETYQEHWYNVHHASSALLVCLLETSTHSRVAWGMATSSFQEIVEVLCDGNDWNTNGEPKQLYHAGGGYGPPSKHQASLLLQAIIKEQRKLVPAALKAVMDTRASEKLARQLAREEEARRRKDSARRGSISDTDSQTGAGAWVEAAKRGKRQKLKAITTPLTSSEPPIKRPQMPPPPPPQQRQQREQAHEQAGPSHAPAPLPQLQQQQPQVEATARPRVTCSGAICVGKGAIGTATSQDGESLEETEARAMRNAEELRLAIEAATGVQDALYDDLYGDIDPLAEGDKLDERILSDEDEPMALE